MNKEQLVMKSKTTEEPAYGSQFIDVLKSRNALYVAGSLTLFASLALGVALVSANVQTPPGEIATSLTVEQARAIVAPLYEALNEPTKKDVPALLANATNPDYQSCSTNSDCLSRDQLAGVFTALGKIIPDLHWTIKDIWTSGNRIVVRGEATGTPTFNISPSIDFLIICTLSLNPQRRRTCLWSLMLRSLLAKD
jgi:hypothetical protein